MQQEISFDGRVSTFRPEAFESAAGLAADKSSTLSGAAAGYFRSPVDG